MIANVLRALEFLGLSIWLGSDIFLSFVVAPGAFAVLASRDQAGTIVGYALTRMHWMGIVCGVAFLLLRGLRMWTATGRVAAPATACVLVMILLTLASQLTVTPKMAALRARIGSIEHAGAADAPLLAEFTRLHGVSVALESGVLLAGLAALFLLVKERAP